MATRLAVADSDLLGVDSTRSRGSHSCSLVIIDRPAGWDIERIMEFVDGRLVEAPRYRQRIRKVPFGLARAVWVDDPDFDLSFHVRRSALPAPGGRRQLADLVARLVDRPLESGRPLWEMYLIEGLRDGRLAVLTKGHHALVSGQNAVDLAQVLLSDAPFAPEADYVPTWTPVLGPGDGVLILDAMTSFVAHPFDVWRRSTRLAGLTDQALRWVVGAVTVPLLRSPAGPAHIFAVDKPRGSRVGLAEFPLERVRELAGNYDCTVNDVVLAVLCGALRSWIISCGRPLATADSLRVIVPLAVRAESEEESDSLFAAEERSTAEITSALIGMPVGEPNPRMRLAQIARETRAHRQGREAVGAQTLARLSGFAPPTLHALGSRAAQLLPEGSYDLLVTNAPGPQHRMFWGDGELDEVYPVPALLHGQGLAIAVTSYDGTVFCGFTADRQAVPDVEELGEFVDIAIDELAGS